MDAYFGSIKTNSYGHQDLNKGHMKFQQHGKQQKVMGHKLREPRSSESLSRTSGGRIRNI